MNYLQEKMDRMIKEENKIKKTNEEIAEDKHDEIEWE
jgi:hypothetical protein